MSTQFDQSLDSLLDIEWTDDEQCDHSMHGKGKVHGGPAMWWQDSTCSRCGYRMRGYRCQPFVNFISAIGYMRCTRGCGQRFDVVASQIFTPLGKE